MAAATWLGGVGKVDRIERDTHRARNVNRGLFEQPTGSSRQDSRLCNAALPPSGNRETSFRKRELIMKIFGSLSIRKFY